MADWNLEVDAEADLTLSKPGAGESLPGKELPSRLKRSWRPPPDDSIPAGPTALYRAFVLEPNDPAGPASTGGQLAGDSSSRCLNSLDPVDASAWASRSGQGSSFGRRLPSVGDELKGFRLRMELGRGAFARVFLAEEVNLGHRLVALKISRAEGEEPTILARLQHPHIVPIHSVHDDPVSGLRLLCMPFLGGANLAQLLHEAWGLAPNLATGQSLVDALDHLSQRLPSAVGQEASLRLARSRRARAGSLRVEPERAGTEGAALQASTSSRGNRGISVVRLRFLFSRLLPRPQHAPAVGADVDQGRPSRQFLRGANGVEASVWIVARLAEGLNHAHERGLLHRDLKPANVLVTADGTPMLLDFNLAAETVSETEGPEEAGEMTRAILGGTLPYMSPEHLDAFDPQGSTLPQDVDERADLYSLGLILFEMISGEHASPEPAGGLPPLQIIRTMRQDRLLRPVPSLRQRCPDVPWSLDALVAHCLEPDPDRRYATAGHLAEDLRRFLEDLPMKHCAEPSIRERAAKWARRHPTLSSSTSIAAAALMLLVTGAVAAGAVYDGMLGLAARMRRQTMNHEFTEVQFLLNTAGRREATLRRGILQARSILKGAGIHDPVWRSPARARTEPDIPSSASARWIGRLTREEATQVKRDLIELLMLEARAGLVLAESEGTPRDRPHALRRAIARLDQAERIKAPIPSVLYSERAAYLERLGDPGPAALDRERAARLVPRGSRDLTLLGTSLLEAGDTAGAEAALRLAINKDGSSLWAWFAMGHCHFEQARYSDAVADFSAAVACGDSHAWTHFNQGLALARSGRPLDARLAYDRALELDGDLVEARVNRGLVELELDETDAALADLRAAVVAGCREVGVLAALGEAFSRAGRLDDANALFCDLLARSPGDPLVLVARGMTLLDRDPAAALSDFSAVLRCDPRSPMAHYGMARLIRSRDPAGALVHLDVALEADPDQMDALQLRALERARAGNRGALDDVERLLHTPSTDRLYNAACALALIGARLKDRAQLDRAVDVLTQALRAGFDASRAATDPDLVALRQRSDFVRLIARFRASPAPEASRKPASRRV
jgi:serine/threonine protein kinase/tetratricopeptide (TPR) repeat protein